jgi:HEAT repeat protein
MILAMSVENRCWLPNVILVCLIGVGCAGAWPSQASEPNPSTTAEALSPEMRSLLAKLQEASAEVRAAAASELGEMGQEGAAAISLLIDLLKDTRPVREGESVAAVASAALVSMGKPAAEACLAAVREKPAREQYDMIRQTIAKFKDEAAVAALIAGTRHPDAEARHTTVHSLRFSEDPRVAHAIIEAFADRDDYTRHFAIMHFVRHVDSRAVLPLVERLQDADGSIRREAARALGVQGDRRAIPPLLDRVHDEHESSYVQRVAAEALGRIGGPGAFESLTAILATPDLPMGERPGARDAMDYMRRIVSSDVWGRRLGAVQGLGHLGDRRASEQLRAVLSDTKESDPIRIAAAESLAQIEGRNVIPLLTKIVIGSSEPVMVRFHVAVVLAKASEGVIDDERIVSALTRWGYSASPIHRLPNVEAAITALRVIANRSNNEQVRTAARDALHEAEPSLEKLRRN